MQWCNLTFTWQFWATNVCLWASKISKICLFGCPTGWATSWKANVENYSRYLLIEWYQFLSKWNSMNNMSFCFRHCFCCPLVSLKVMQHYVQVSYLIIGLTINAISVTITVKGWHWRWLIYALHNFLLHNNMLRVFRSNHHCSWKFHGKTPVLESLFFLKMMKLYKDICSAWINHTFVEFFSHRLTS